MVMGADDGACGKRIRTARRLAGLSVPELARIVQRSDMTLYRYEWGKRSVSIADCLLLAAVLRCTPEWLAFGAGNPPERVREDRMHKRACAR